MAFYQKQAICFECTQCGQCCSGKESYVFISKAEAESIRRSLKLSVADFKKQYLDKHPDGDLVLAQHEDGDCIFIEKKVGSTPALEHKSGCQIYKNRPAQCSTYPFWPEILESKKAWLKEGARCEGIDRGKEITVAEIQSALASLPGL